MDYQLVEESRVQNEPKITTWNFRPMTLASTHPPACQAAVVVVLPVAFHMIIQNLALDYNQITTQYKLTMDHSTTSSSTYSKAIAFNNQGALHLSHGRFLNAAKSFHSALDTIKASMDEPCKQEEEEPLQNYKRASFEWSEDPTPRLKVDVMDEHDDSFVFRRALVITPSDNVHDNEHVSESAAILYNLALAYHLYGMESKSRFLPTALRFYELSFGLYHSGEGDIHDLFDLALLNNLGQIHHLVLDFTKSEQCFIHLNQELQQSVVMDKRDYMGFLLNTTLQAPSAAPCA
jgi:tetratricopeptide (TPR) repeat protein